MNKKEIKKVEKHPNPEDVVSISVEELKIGAKVYLTLKDGTIVWAGGRIEKVFHPCKESAKK